MKTTLIASAEFDSTHEDETCSPTMHGHTFHVEVESEKPAQAELDAVVAEVDLRVLGRMLNGGSQRVDSLAAWFLDRMIVTNPDVQSATVAFRRQKATVRRERR